VIEDLGHGTAIQVMVEGDPLKRVENLTAPRTLHHILDAIGALIETQTKERFMTTKTAPDGVPWQAWSDSYAEQQERSGNKNRSLLIHGGMGSQHLYRANTHIVHDGDMSVEVGNNVRYGAVHQHGADFSIVSTGRTVSIPARPYLGISAEDGREIDDLVGKLMESLL